MLITLEAIHWPRRYAMARQRAQALRMILEGKTPTQIAREVKVHPNTVLNWKNAARKEAND